MKNMPKIYSLVFLLSLLFSAHAQAVKPVYSGGKSKAAIRGYDVVAYFTENEAIPGSEEIKYHYLGAKWLFSTNDHRELFIANPDKYIPQYGGYCAYAVARNNTASIKPEYFTLHKGKLYLNYSKSVYKRWTKDKEEYIQEANSHWPELLKR